MTISRPAAMLMGSLLLLTGGATAQISLTPPGLLPPPGSKAAPQKSAPQKAAPRKAAPKAPAKAAPKAPAKAPPKAAPKAPPAAAPTKPAAPPPAPPAAATAPADPNVDLVYGAYQRGAYKTTFNLATKRAQEDNDPKAMTMLGELYANGLGVKRDYVKAGEWYKRAAEIGDPQAMFALAMQKLS